MHCVLYRVKEAKKSVLSGNSQVEHQQQQWKPRAFTQSGKAVTVWEWYPTETEAEVTSAKGSSDVK